MNILSVPRRAVRWVKARQPKAFAAELCEELKLEPLFHGEVQFWAIELALKGAYPENIKGLLDRTKKTHMWPAQVEPLLKELGGRPKVLDVGAGPISAFSWGHLNGLIELTAADPLANAYKRILAHYGHLIGHELETAPGEHISSRFGEEAFDLVWMRNALDHSQDPAETFRQLVRVTKPGGFLVIGLMPCEGTAEAWSGLHQHDLWVEAGGRLMLQSRDIKNKTLSAARCLNEGHPLEMRTSSEPTRKHGTWAEVVWRRTP